MPFRASAWPRSSARPYLWTWRIVHGYPWAIIEEQHINKLELLATLNTIKWRLRRTGHQGSRFIHLVDSQVTGSIVTKGRSGSRLLRPGLAKLASLVLAGNLYPVYLYVASEDNPADIPSRRKWAKQKSTKISKLAKRSELRKVRSNNSKLLREHWSATDKLIVD